MVSRGSGQTGLPDTPTRPPWDEPKAIIERLDRLIALQERQAGPAPSAPKEESLYPERFAVPEAATIAPIPQGLSATDLLSLILSITQRASLYAFGREARWIPFTDSIAALATAKEEQVIPFDGLIPTLIVVFPDGPVTSSGITLVDARLLYGSNFVVPGVDNKYLSFNNTLLVFPANHTVVKGQKLYFERSNYDSANAHTISAFVLLLKTDGGT